MKQEIYIMDENAFRRFLKKESISKDIINWNWTDIRQDGTLMKVVIDRKGK